MAATNGGRTACDRMRTEREAAASRARLRKRGLLVGHADYRWKRQ
ncbi:hypothetical protein [Streptomyces sp. x-80]|jgi:hypothetical protein